MLQEMKLEDALKRFLRGRKVLVMYDETLEADKPAFTVEPLEEMLKRNRFLVEVPAVENPDFSRVGELIVYVHPTCPRLSMIKGTLCSSKIRCREYRSWEERR